MCLTTLGLFSTLFLLDLYYLAVSVLKIKRRSYHATMFMLILVACLSVMLSCAYKLVLIREYDTDGNPSKKTEMAYLSFYELFLVFNNIVHTLFITKYWVLSIKVKQIKD
jgi:hypothetical protein